jgi:hypothetical protein
MPEEAGRPSTLITLMHRLISLQRLMNCIRLPAAGFVTACTCCALMRELEIEMRKAIARSGTERHTEG